MKPCAASAIRRAVATESRSRGRGTPCILSAMTVRPAEPGDAQRIEEVRVAGWHWAYAALIDAEWLAGFVVTPDRVQRWAERIAEPLPGSVVVVAEQDGVVRGFAAAGPCRDDDARDAFELAALYVDPTAARRGIGTALLRAAVDGRPEPTLLWVLEGNTGARRFYERHRFAWDGTRKFLDHLPHDVPELRYRRSPAGN